MSTPRLGVVGTGWWATQHHIPSLVAYEGADLTALADSDPDRLAAAAARFGVARTFPDPNDLFTSGLVDGVVIAVPHAHHYRLARAALDAGLHVLVEKPMVLRAAHAWDLVHRASAGDLHLMVGYTYQFTPAARRCRDLLQSGAIGELLLVSGLFASMAESYFRGRPDDYRSALDFSLTGPAPSTYSDPAIAGGGQGQSQITHAMGMVLFTTGASVDEVHAYMANRDLAVDLVDAISYRFAGGALGTMASTGGLAPGQPHQEELRYYGTDGFVLQDLAAGTLEAHLADGQCVLVDAPELPYPAPVPARALADLVAGHGENLAPPEPAARTVEFLEAAYQSVGLGRPVRTAALDSASETEPTA